MRRRRLWTSAALAIALITGTSPLARAQAQATAEHSVRATIDSLSTAFSTAIVSASAAGWTREAVASIAAFYADDALLLPPGRGAPDIRGHDAVVAHWTRAPSHHILAHRVQIERFEASPTLVADHGSVELRIQNADAAPLDIRLRYVSVWRREADGRWRKALDTWWD